MKGKWLRTTAIGLLTASACVFTGAFEHAAADTVQNELPGTPGCFFVRNVWGWKVLDDSTLIVHAPMNQNAYLVKLFRPVQALDSYVKLGFQDVEHTGRICNSSRDNLVVPDYTPPRIPIVAVRALTMPEQAQVLKDAGKSAVSDARADSGSSAKDADVAE